VFQPDYFAASSYIEALAFNDGRGRGLSVIGHREISDGFVQVFQMAFLLRLYPDSEPWDTAGNILKDIMEKCRPFCPPVENGYYWRGVLLQVQDDCCDDNDDL
jgi:hypothetical protein